MHTPAAWLIAAAIALSLAACGGGTKDLPPPPLDVPAAKLPSSKTSHVVVIVMENKEYGDVIGNPDAPYLNGLARRYAAPRSVYGIRHPSLPNYLALIGGDTFGVDSDCTSCHVRGRTLVEQLEQAGRSWRAYMQGMPHPCFKGAEHGQYAKKHDPFMYFDSIRGSSRRCRNVVPYERLRHDLRHGKLRDFSFISPGLCADTHDCSVRTGDRFLAGLVPALLRELGPRGVLMVTYDEGTTDRGCCGVAQGGHIATVIAGPRVRRRAHDGAYTLYSVLRTVEDHFGLPPLRAASRARPFAVLPARP